MKSLFKFLVDTNLPKWFRFFNNESFTHVSDLNPTMPDTNIWDLALSKGFVVLTKDSDFYYRCLESLKSPKIVYFKLGNMTFKQLQDFFEKNWDSILDNLPQTRLMLVERNKITIIISETALPDDLQNQL